MPEYPVARIVPTSPTAVLLTLADDQTPGQIGKATDKAEAYRYLFALALAGNPEGSITLTWQELKKMMADGLTKPYPEDRSIGLPI